MKRYYDKVLSISTSIEFSEFLCGVMYDNKISRGKNIQKLHHTLVQTFNNNTSLKDIKVVIGHPDHPDGNLKCEPWHLIALFNALKSDEAKFVSSLSIHDQLYESNEQMEEVIQSLAVMFKTNSSLRSLSFSQDIGLSTSAAQLLASGLKENVSLRSVEFGGVHDEGVACILLNATNANFVKVDNLLKSNESVLKLAYIIKNNSNLLSLKSYSDAPGDLDHLDMRPLAKALKHNNTLGVLEVAENCTTKISDDSKVAFNRLLREDNNNTLIILDPFTAEINDDTGELQNILEFNEGALYKTVQLLADLDILSLPPMLMLKLFWRMKEPGKFY